MKAIIVAACALCLAGPAAGKEYAVDLRADPEQRSQFIQGREAIISRLPASNALILESVDPFGKRAVIVVGVINNGSTPFNFGPENVKVSVGEETVAMVTYDDLLREQKRREGRQRLAMAFAGAMNSASASYSGNSYGTATYSGTTHGMVAGQPFSARTTGIGTYSGYDAGAAEVAKARADAENARSAAVMESKLANRRAQIEQVVRVNTLMPGQAFNGPLQFDVPDEVAKSKAPVPVVITLIAGEEQHTFHALLGTAKAFRAKK